MGKTFERLDFEQLEFLSPVPVKVANGRSPLPGGKFIKLL